ncbi:MAG: hypothetical protein WC817_04130 [Patescibacteria group bacterium]|jgi:hypothetical protein
MKLKLPITYIVRYGYAFIVTLMCLIFAAILWFIYGNVYVPLTQATFLAELQARVALISVNKKDLKDVLDAMSINAKPTAIDWSSARNPFIIEPAVLSPVATDSQNPAVNAAKQPTQ